MSSLPPLGLNLTDVSSQAIGQSTGGDANSNALVNALVQALRQRGRLPFQNQLSKPQASSPAAPVPAATPAPSAGPPPTTAPVGGLPNEANVEVAQAARDAYTPYNAPDPGPPPKPQQDSPLRGILDLVGAALTARTPVAGRIGTEQGQRRQLYTDQYNQAEQQYNDQNNAQLRREQESDRRVAELDKNLYDQEQIQARDQVTAVRAAQIQGAQQIAQQRANTYATQVADQHLDRLAAIKSTATTAQERLEYQNKWNMWHDTAAMIRAGMQRDTAIELGSRREQLAVLIQNMRDKQQDKTTATRLDYQAAYNAARQQYNLYDAIIKAGSGALATPAMKARAQALITPGPNGQPSPYDKLVQQATTLGFSPKPDQELQSLQTDAQQAELDAMSTATSQIDSGMPFDPYGYMAGTPALGTGMPSEPSAAGPTINIYPNGPQQNQGQQQQGTPGYVGSPTYGSGPHQDPNWKQAVLKQIGAPATASNLAFLDAWNHAEGGTAAWNPLNTTHDAPGATAYNDNGGNPVRNYPSAQEGDAMTAQTLLAGRYPTIVAALKAGNPYDPRFSSAIPGELSTWGTNPNFYVGSAPPTTPVRPNSRTASATRTTPIVQKQATPQMVGQAAITMYENDPHTRGMSYDQAWPQIKQQLLSKGATPQDLAAAEMALKPHAEKSYAATQKAQQDQQAHAMVDARSQQMTAMGVPRFLAPQVAGAIQEPATSSGLTPPKPQSPIVVAQGILAAFKARGDTQNGPRAALQALMSPPYNLRPQVAQALVQRLMTGVTPGNAPTPTPPIAQLGLSR